MPDITHRFIKTNEITLHVAELGDGPLVLLLHGWPELWYSWRRQLLVLAAAGYHAVAPDIRGYGQSDAPIAMDAYYASYFQEPGVAEAEFEANVARAMRTIFAGTAGFDTTAPAVRAKRKGDGFLAGIEVPNTLPAWLSDEDLAYFVMQYEASGFRGGVNRYRNMDRDWEELPELATARIEQPALFITGEKDPARSLAPTDAMRSCRTFRKSQFPTPAIGSSRSNQKS
ncbi:MAG: alpha/beta hydrolase [Deltaproteobacteria bacterium]